MRRTIVLTALALTAVLVPAGTAGAALYRGGGDGVHVEFRVRGGEIVFAKLRTPLYCLAGYGGGRRLRRFGVAWNVDGYFPGVSVYHSSPIRLHRGGRFSEPSGPEGPEEPGYSYDEVLVGRVGPRRARGRFHFSNEYRTPGRSEVCRTGHFPGVDAGRAGGFVFFRARRRG